MVVVVVVMVETLLFLQCSHELEESEVNIASPKSIMYIVGIETVIPHTEYRVEGVIKSLINGGTSHYKYTFNRQCKQEGLPFNITLPALIIVMKLLYKELYKCIF